MNEAILKTSQFVLARGLCKKYGLMCSNARRITIAKNIFVWHLYALLVLLNAAYGQSAKEQQFNTAVKEIVTAFSKQDATRLSAFIKKGTGVYQVYRPGVYDAFAYYKAIHFSDTAYPAILFTEAKELVFAPIQYAPLPVWSCSKEAWTKRGLFVDTAKINHLLSATCKYRNKYVPDHISNQKIQTFYKLEMVSRRIVISDKNGKDLVFYLSWLDGGWWLTIVDNVSSDCGV